MHQHICEDQIVRLVAILDQHGLPVPEDIRDHRNHIVNGKPWSGS